MHVGIKKKRLQDEATENEVPEVQACSSESPQEASVAGTERGSSGSK